MIWDGYVVAAYDRTRNHLSLPTLVDAGLAYALRTTLFI